MACCGMLPGLRIVPAGFEAPMLPWGVPTETESVYSGRWVISGRRPRGTTLEDLERSMTIPTAYLTDRFKAFEVEFRAGSLAARLCWFSNACFWARRRLMATSTPRIRRACTRPRRRRPRPRCPTRTCCRRPRPRSRPRPRRLRHPPHPPRLQSARPCWRAHK